MSFDLFNFDYPPPGSRYTMVLLGILVPCVIGYFSVHAWMDQVAYWPARRGGGMTVRGEAAQACAVAYISIGMFFHFRWFWGSKQQYCVYQIGAVCSLLGFFGGVAYAFFAILFF
jgi:hypothetical protein